MRAAGRQFNGFSQAFAYGNDAQCATNYPIVRFTNIGSGHVFYGRTHDHSTIAVGYSGPAYTHLDVPDWLHFATGAFILLSQLCEFCGCRRGQLHLD